MQITLKNLRTFPSLSEETHCFTATLWVDGRKIGSIANHGQGGPDEFHGDEKAFAEADAWCKANLPRWSMESEIRPQNEALADQQVAAGNTTESFETDLEMHVANLINDHLTLQDMKRALARNVLYRKPDVPGLWQIKIDGSKNRTVTMITGQLRAQGVTQILHEMSTEDALRAYRAG